MTFEVRCLIANLVWQLFHSTCWLFVTDLPALTCDRGSSFIASIYSCVTLADTLDPTFSEALLKTKTCAGGVFTTADSLLRLRMCNIVRGSVILESIADPIDTTVFWDIQTITGNIELRDCRNTL